MLLPYFMYLEMQYRLEVQMPLGSVRAGGGRRRAAGAKLGIGTKNDGPSSSNVIGSSAQARYSQPRLFVSMFGPRRSTHKSSMDR